MGTVIIIAMLKKLKIADYEVQGTIGVGTQYCNKAPSGESGWSSTGRPTSSMLPKF